jgi:hypothetical protein
LETGSSDSEEQLPTLLTSSAGRTAGFLKGGSELLVQGGKGIVQRGSSSIYKGSSAVLSKVDPRKMLGGEKEGSGEYLSVGKKDADGLDLLSSEEAGQTNEKRRTATLCAYGSLVLLWFFAFAGAFLLFSKGVLTAILGTTYAELLLVALASPILTPCLATLLPWMGKQIQALRGSKCYLWLTFAALWCALLAVFTFLWDLGVMQVVIGVIFSQIIMVVLALLLVIPCVVYALPKLKDAVVSVPSYIRRKLWEIPPLILPMFESMIKGLLHEMEQRILDKLKDMPKDVSKAVIGVGGNVKDLGKKGFSRARSVATNRSFRQRSMSDGNLDLVEKSA